MRTKFRKSLRYRTLTGTIGGVSEYLKIDYAWLKVIFSILVLLSKGWLLLLYMFLVLVMPGQRSARRIQRVSAMAYFKNFGYHLRLVLTSKPYSQIFGAVFLTMGALWASYPMRIVPAVLLILGATLFFNPFGLSVPAGLTNGVQNLSDFTSSQYISYSAYEKSRPN